MPKQPTITKLQQNKCQCGPNGKVFVRRAAYLTHLQKQHPLNYIQEMAAIAVMEAEEGSDLVLPTADAMAYCDDGRVPKMTSNRWLDTMNTVKVGPSDFGEFEDSDHLVNMMQFTNPQRSNYASIPRKARTTKIARVEVDPRGPKFDDLGDAPYDPAYRVFDPAVPNDPTSNTFNPWFPFSCAEDFKLAHHLYKHNASKKQITDYFNNGISQRRSACGSDLCNKAWHPSYQSPHGLRKLVDQMEPLLGDESWNAGDSLYYGDEKNEWQPLFFRDIDVIVLHLLQQPAFKDVLKYAAEKEFNDAGERVFSEFHTADWWWEEQGHIHEGDALVPLIFASDETEFSTHGGDKKGWPVYMTIGNLPSDVRSRPNANAWVLLAMLPIPPKQDSQAKHGKLWTDYKNDVMHQAIEHILHRYNELYDRGLYVPCSDGKERIVHPVMGGWIADLKEYTSLLHVQQNCCMVCDIPAKAMGNGEQGQRRDQEAIKRKMLRFIALEKLLTPPPDEPLPKPLSSVEKKMHTSEKNKLLQYFSSIGVRPYYNTFWDLRRSSPEAVWRPDVLHTIYEGMVKKVFKWLEPFLREFDRYRVFNIIWLSTPAFNNVSPPSKSIFEISQLTGKELRVAMRRLLPVLTIALRERTHCTEVQKKLFDKVIICVRNLIDFCLMTHYQSHTEATVALMEGYLRKFHEHKDVFLKYKASAKTKKNVKVKGKAMRDAGAAERQTQLEERGFYEKDVSASNISAATKKVTDAMTKAESNMNFPKIHHLLHFGWMILFVGFLQQWSTETSETLHKDLKDGYRSSNKNDATVQVIRFATRRYAIRMRELNLEHIARAGHYQVEIQDVLGIYADSQHKNMAASLSRAGYSFAERTKMLQRSRTKSGKGVSKGLPEEIVDEEEMDDIIPTDPDNDEFDHDAPDASETPLDPWKMEASTPDESQTPLSPGKSVPLLPLFRQATPLKRRWVKGAVKKLRNFRRLDQIQEHYKLPVSLSSEIGSYVKNTLELGQIPEAALSSLHAEVKTSVHIVVDNFNAEGHNVMKAMCTAPNTITSTGKVKIRQDNVFYKTADQQPNGIFGDQNVGKLLCILKLRLPHQEIWGSMVHTPRLAVDASLSTDHLVALIQPYKIDRGGHMDPVSDLARCTRTTKFMMVSIDAITRVAMLIAEPTPEAATDPSEYPKAWWINNRIDDGTWNLFY